MNLYQAVVLGVVQGMSEFLPVSSSAHLVLTPWLLGWPDPGLSYDVALHVGTLAAILACFWRDWWSYLADGLLRGRQPERRLFWSLALATLPAAGAGLLLQDLAASTLRAPALIAVNLMLMGLILAWADRRSERRRGQDLAAFGVGAGLAVGLFQALALVPGVSRSGITITAALLLGFSREAAARFSFLLSAPVIAGAALLQLRHLPAGAVADPAFAAGVVASAVAGFLSIRFLLRLLRGGNYLPFVYYRLALGIVVLALAAAR